MTEPKPCAHHWLIAPPNGPTSLGTCKKCEATQEFSNSERDSIRSWHIKPKSRSNAQRNRWTEEARDRAAATKRRKADA